MAISLLLQEGGSLIDQQNGDALVLEDHSPDTNKPPFVHNAGHGQ